MNEKISGNLEAFFETGTEGIIWSFFDNKDNGYDSINHLKNGDYIEVYNESNSIIWSGVVCLEYKRRYTQFPLNPKYGQQEVFGYWVHGFQENEDPEIWAKMFFDKSKAILIKK